MIIGEIGKIVKGILFITIMKKIKLKKEF